VVSLPLDGLDEDPAFGERWASGPQFATPLYYRPHLERFPERSARVIAAIAAAEPGGVLVHCVGGRDRTGQIAMLLLALAGVAPEAIAADYELSSAGLTRRYEALGEEDQGPALEEYLAAPGQNGRRRDRLDTGRHRRRRTAARRRTERRDHGSGAAAAPRLRGFRTKRDA
jgi:hypothetical protein